MFQAQHPELFKRDGTLKSEYIKAQNIIGRMEMDDLYGLLMSGQKQVIRTGEIAGVPFKVKIDSLLDGDTCAEIVRRFPETASVMGLVHIAAHQHGRSCGGPVFPLQPGQLRRLAAHEILNLGGTHIGHLDIRIKVILRRHRRNVLHLRHVRLPRFLQLCGSIPARSKNIEKVAGSGYFEDWPGVAVQLYIEHGIKAFGEVVSVLFVYKRTTIFILFGHGCPSAVRWLIVSIHINSARRRY